jgi:hypothetical protein
MTAMPDPDYPGDSDADYCDSCIDTMHPDTDVLPPKNGTVCSNCYDYLKKVLENKEVAREAYKATRYTCEECDTEGCARKPCGCKRADGKQERTAAGCGVRLVCGKSAPLDSSTMHERMVWRRAVKEGRDARRRS